MVSISTPSPINIGYIYCIFKSKSGNSKSLLTNVIYSMPELLRDLILASSSKLKYEPCHTNPALSVC